MAEDQIVQVSCCDKNTEKTMKCQVADKVKSKSTSVDISP